MYNARYRLKNPMIAILTCDNEHKFAITIPEGGAVEVEAELNGNRLVDVTWEGKTLTMFTVDLQTRGEPVMPKSAAG